MMERCAPTAKADNAPFVGCESADMDQDNDVDARDFATLAAGFTG